MKRIMFFRCRDVKFPSKAHPSDAGWDFFVPEFNDSFIKDLQDKNPDLRSVPNAIYPSILKEEKTIILPPQTSILIPSGIRVVLPENTALIAFNKSSIASKYGLIVGAQVVDENYRGEIHLNLLNVSQKYREIKEGMKIVQFVLLNIPVCEAVFEEFDGNSVEEFLKKYSTDRGEKGFGSTGLF